MNSTDIKDGNASADWSETEDALIVADYFDMLRTELMRQDYNKTEHRRRLMPRLRHRSNGSVEFKHQNISAVLVDLGYPYIDGYKPRFNKQGLLSQQVESYLAKHPDFFEQLSRAPLLDPEAPPKIGRLTLNRIFQPPPERTDRPNEPMQPWVLREGRTTDFVRRDAENRRLGELGERFILDIEKRRLIGKGRDDLAHRVEWISHTRGDGIGFDILSFSDEDDSERLVEVKTTGLGKYFPFYVSANELRCSEFVGRQYHLYRVFTFSTAPRVYVLRGPLSQACRLDPTQYRAVI